MWYTYIAIAINSTEIYRYKISTLYGKTFEWENFRGCEQNTLFTGKLSQAVAFMYCTQQVIQGENFRDWLKNRKNRESFAIYSSIYSYYFSLVMFLCSIASTQDLD